MQTSLFPLYIRTEMLRYPKWKQNESEIRNCFGNILWYFVYYFTFCFMLMMVMQYFPLILRWIYNYQEQTHTLCDCNYIPKSQKLQGPCR